ncbi:hypothetical protein D3C78_1597000 [compost metagenome]
MSGWLFAAFLGVARAWNHVLPYLHVMGAFVAFSFLACCVALAVAGRAGSVGAQKNSVPG